MNVLEIVKWKGNNGVSDEEMIKTVEQMLPDLQELEGFISQTLYKDSEWFWLDIYYWDIVKNAQLSNERMEWKESLNALLKLIDLNTVSIEIMNSLQSSQKK